MAARPDILVLGAGGVLGEAWMTGVLAGIEDAAGIDFRRCEHFVGTSAGSIVAVRLVAGERLQRPRRSGGNEPPADERGLDAKRAIYSRFASSAGSWALALSAPATARALRVAAAGGAALRAAALRAAPRPEGAMPGLRRAVQASGASFDGRLRVVAVDRASGRRVVFGAPGAPRATVAEAVLASCAVPWLVAPVRINGREYVDGAVWSPSNLDAAPAGRGTRVLCLNATSGLTPRHPLLRAAREAARAAIALEAQALRGRGARVRAIAPDRIATESIGLDPMARAPRARVLAAGYRQGLTLASATRE